MFAITKLSSQRKQSFLAAPSGETARAAATSSPVCLLKTGDVDGGGRGLPTSSAMARLYLYLRVWAKN